jgi:outer membrane protein
LGPSLGLRLAGLAIVGILGVSGAPAANAQQAQAIAPADPSGPRIMVVDIQWVQQESAAARGIQQALERRRETFQREIASQEDRLRTAEQELARQRGQLPTEAFAQRRREFEQQVIDGQRQVQERSRTLEQGLNEAMRVVQTNVMQIVAEVALERGANIVLAKHQVLIFDRSLDVTQTVLERLNRRLPEVVVNIAAP